MYTTLLVPIDGSKFSARALPVAAALARRTGATLHVALVNDPSAYIPFVPGEVAVPLYDADLVKERREADQLTIDREVVALTAQGVRAVGTLLDGTVVETLVEYGQQIASELTIMTTHGRGGFARLRLGSIATAYLTRATTPVLLVHGTELSAEHSEEKGVYAPTLPTAPLLCALDGSPFAETMLPHAAQFADACGLTIELFSVTMPHSVDMAPFGTESLLADPTALQLEEEGRRAYLTRMAAACPPGTTTHCVTDMTAGRAILEEAVRINAGAIAMATHGRGGLSRMVLGSVADEVLRHATVPMLIYRPEK